MSYSIIDPALASWISKKGLKLFTSFKDEVVRSTEVVDRNGNRYQIWIEPADASGQYPVCAWDFKKKRVRFLSSAKELESNLDNAFAEVQKWMASNP